MKSRTHQNAIAMCILQVGELAKHLSEDFRNRHGEIPWAAIARTRDAYAHHYGHMDFAIVWATAIEDIPAVLAFCKQFMSE